MCPNATIPGDHSRAFGCRLIVVGESAGITQYVYTRFLKKTELLPACQLLNIICYYEKFPGAAMSSNSCRSTTNGCSQVSYACCYCYRIWSICEPSTRWPSIPVPYSHPSRMAGKRTMYTSYSSMKSSLSFTSGMAQLCEWVRTIFTSGMEMPLPLSTKEGVLWESLSSMMRSRLLIQISLALPMTT